MDFEPVVGSEIGKTRPALLVSNNDNNRYAATVTVLPITSAPARRDYPDEVTVPQGVAGLSRNSRIKVSHIPLTPLDGIMIGTLISRYSRSRR